MADLIPGEKWFSALHPEVQALYRRSHPDNPEPYPQITRLGEEVIPLEIAIWYQELNDVERLRDTKTLNDAVVILDDIAPFWTDHERQKAYKIHAASVLRCTRQFLVKHKKQYKGLPPIPADWLGILDWLTEAKRVLAGGSHLIAKELAAETPPAARETTTQKTKEPEWSRITNKITIVTALGLPNVPKLNKLVEQSVYEIKQASKKRQDWQIRIDKLPDYQQKKLR